MLVRLFEQREAPTKNWLERIHGGGALTASGVWVNPDVALTMSAVYACVRVLAESVASLPLITYRRVTGGGKERATTHAMYSVLHDAPNAEMTSLQFREAMVANQCLWGNAYARIVFDGGGRVRELWPLLSRYMQVRRENGRLTYRYDEPGQQQTLTAEQVLHVPALGINGVMGISPITLARQAIGLGLAMQEFGAGFFGNGALPGIVLMHPGQMSDPAYKRLKESWEERHRGPENAQKVALLEEGAKAEKIGVPPEDAQFLQSRKFQIGEIARIFRVPPHLVGDLEKATFSNIEQQSLEFVVYTLAPWLVRWEQAIALRLLTASERREYFVEHLVDGLLRGDIVSRYNAYHVARQDGWLNADEIRAKENMNPIGGDAGQTYWTPMNVQGNRPTSRGVDEETEGLVREVVAFLRRNTPAPNGNGHREAT